jgi:hypothetical protein
MKEQVQYHLLATAHSLGTTVSCGISTEEACDTYANENCNIIIPPP